MQRSKLYLNPIFSKLGTQLLCVLIVNRVHAEAPRALQIQWPVIDEKTLLWRALSDFQSDAKDGFFGLAGAHVAGAKENQKVPAKVERLDAVLGEFQPLIIDGADKISVRAGKLLTNSEGLRVCI